MRGSQREECRVEGKIYLPSAAADQIIRQKPGVDGDGGTGRGRWTREASGTNRREEDEGGEKGREGRGVGSGAGWEASGGGSIGDGR